MDDALIGAIIGGVISGGVGIFIVRYTSRLKDNEWMKLNVYAKLYDWFSTRLNDFQFMDELVYANDSKSKLTSSEYAKLDKKIREKFDTFVKEGEKWDKTFGSIKNKFTDRRTKIFENLCSPLKESNLLSNENILQIDGPIQIDNLLEPFFYVLIEPSISDSETLYQKMREYAKKKGLHQFEYLKEIKNKRPEFFELISKQLPSLRNNIFSDVKYDDLIIHGEKTKHVLANLVELLKRKIR